MMAKLAPLDIKFAIFQRSLAGQAPGLRRMSALRRSSLPKPRPLHGEPLSSLSRRSAEATGPSAAYLSCLTSHDPSAEVSARGRCGWSPGRRAAGAADVAVGSDVLYRNKTGSIPSALERWFFCGPQASQAPPGSVSLGTAHRETGRGPLGSLLSPDEIPVVCWEGEEGSRGPSHSSHPP